nr:DUF6884 domain-containing protein [Acaryochloris sp. IP29b_bin.137]
MTAINRYDGPSFRVLRRYLRSSNPPVDIRILSAEHGLIPSDYLLPYYDRKMTVGRARYLNPIIISSLEKILSSQSYKSCLISLGCYYLESIKGYEEFIPLQLKVQVANGGIGRKLSILYDWLYGKSSSLNSFESFPTFDKKVYLRGIEISLTQQQIIEVARKAIASETGKAMQCQSWYVKIDKQLVAPKWLVSQLTGLPVNRFVTKEACRVLTQLGIRVQRI